MENTDNRMMTPEEAARYLDISVITLYRRMRERGIKPANYNPMLKRQKEPRYTQKQLDDLKESSAAAA